MEYFVGDNSEDFVKIMKTLPFRVAVCHIALPEGPKFHFLNAVWFLLLASKNERVRTKFHRDLSLLETQYTLLSYGIPVHQIPRTYTGNIKIRNHLQWIKTRIVIDEFRSRCLDVTSLACPIIQHPKRHDVLFSRGGKADHPGNIEFLYDVRERMDEFITNPNGRGIRQKVREEIEASVEARGGRFLQLQKGGWWEELSPDKRHKKISTSMYDYHRKLGVTVPQQATKSDTSMFLPNTKRQKEGDENMNCDCHFF